MEQCRLCPAKLWSNADFAPQNHIDIVSGAKITTEIILKFAPQNYRAFISCPAKSWSNEDFAREITEPSFFAPQDNRAFVLCPAKSRRLRSLPREITEQCRLCSAKSWRHSFRGQKISNLIVSFFLIIFVNRRHFRDL